MSIYVAEDLPTDLIQYWLTVIKEKKLYVRTKVSVYFHESNSYPTSESKFSWLWMNDIVCVEAVVVRKLRYSFRGCISRKLEATVISRLYFFILFYCFYFINEVWAVFSLCAKCKYKNRKANSNSIASIFSLSVSHFDILRPRQ